MLRKPACKCPLLLLRQDDGGDGGDGVEIEPQDKQGGRMMEAMALRLSRRTIEAAG